MAVCSRAVSRRSLNQTFWPLTCAYYIRKGDHMRASSRLRQSVHVFKSPISSHEQPCSHRLLTSTWSVYSRYSSSLALAIITQPAVITHCVLSHPQEHEHHHIRMQPASHGLQGIPSTGALESWNCGCVRGSPSQAVESALVYPSSRKLCHM